MKARYPGSGLEEPISHPVLTIAKDAEDLAAHAAERFIQAARDAIRRDGRFRVALSGGSTPEKLYTLLAQPGAEVDWGRSYFFLGDERFVPLDDPRSNYALIQRTLLASGRVPADHIFPVPVHLATAGAAAAAYEQMLADALGVPDRRRLPRFDLILLGLGDDGHTASLFPHAPSLAVADRWVVDSPPGTLPPPVDRITLTYPVLNAAQTIIFLVAGEKKAAVLQEVLEGRPHPEMRPAAGVRPLDGTVEWLVDEAAAARLTRRSPGWH
jgi:6-phosphogluconolactonase